MIFIEITCANTCDLHVIFGLCYSNLVVLKGIGNCGLLMYNVTSENVTFSAIIRVAAEI